MLVRVRVLLGVLEVVVVAVTADLAIESGCWSGCCCNVVTSHAILLVYFLKHHLR